jgi:hypothetical protein
MARLNAMTESFNEAVFLEKPALFTPIRINRNTIPQGYHLYEVRHDDDCRGDEVEIAHNIFANHWGSIIMRDEIKLLPEGYLPIEPMDVKYGTGDCRTMKEFMVKYPV